MNGEGPHAVRVPCTEAVCISPLRARGGEQPRLCAPPSIQRGRVPERLAILRVEASYDVLAKLAVVAHSRAPSSWKHPPLNTSEIREGILDLLKEGKSWRAFPTRSRGRLEGLNSLQNCLQKCREQYTYGRYEQSAFRPKLTRKQKQETTVQNLYGPWFKRIREFIRKVDESMVLTDRCVISAS